MKTILRFLAFAAWLHFPYRLELRTNAGRDFQSDAMATTGTQPAPANYIALTENATAPAAGDTTLASELTGEGLARSQGIYAHTAGTAVYTVTKLFTKTSGSTRSIAKAGLFNAAAAGTMAFETLLSSLAVMETNDQLTITWTINI